MSRKRIKNEAIETINYLMGSKDKSAARTLSAVNTLRSAFVRKFNIGEREFEIVAIKWFQCATDRIKQKGQKKPRTSKPRTPEEEARTTPEQAEK